MFVVGGASLVDGDAARSGLGGEATARHRAKLRAARSNNRFLDKRLADLEAALVDAQLPPGPFPTSDHYL